MKISKNCSRQNKETFFSSLLPTQGTYTLIIDIPEEKSITVGKLGNFRFPKGSYTYTGSALGKGGLSLRQRVARHLQKEKNKRWHIDFLLSNVDITITAIVAAHSTYNMECEINRSIIEKLGGKIIIKSFGASDCQKHCGSHLLYIGEKNVKKNVYLIYAEKFGSKFTVLDLQKQNSGAPSKI